MHRIDKMTLGQEQALADYRNKCLQIGLATGKADVEAIRPAINALYADIGYDAPYILRVTSPLRANLVITILRASLVDNLVNNLRANLWNILWANLGDNLVDNLVDNLWNILWTNLEDNLGDNLRANLWNILWANLRDNLRVNLGDNLRVEYQSTPLWGSLDIFWIGYYLFPHLYLRPMHSDKQIAELARWETIAKNAFWWYPFDGLCIVSDRPTEIHRDDQGRLHNLTGPSIAFADGWNFYHVHGVEVPPDIIDDPNSITAERIDAEENAEVRRVMIDMFTPERYVAESGAQKVDEDPRFGTIWRKQLSGDEDIYMVEVINSTPEPNGSYRHYWLRIDPAAYEGDAGRISRAAVASTWRNEDGSLVFAHWRDYAPVIES